MRTVQAKTNQHNSTDDTRAGANLLARRGVSSSCSAVAEVETMSFPTKQMKEDAQAIEGATRENKPILKLDYARQGLAYWQAEAERLESEVGYPKKWTRFESTPQNRMRFRVGGCYKIRFQSCAGKAEVECFIREDETIKGGLPILIESGEGDIPFHAIRQVKRID